MSYTLYHDDCRNVWSKLDSQFDLIILDPPYLAEKATYKQRNRHKNKTTGEWVKAKHELKEIVNIPPEEFAAFWLWLLYECGKRLKPSGWFIFKCDDYTYGELYALTKTAFHFFRKMPILWDKKMFGIGTGIRNQHENLPVWRPYDHDSSYFADPTGFSSVIRCANYNHGRFGKTAQQDQINQTPLEVWKVPITQFCPPGGNILDPTMGSGSIGVAVKQLNQRNPSQKRSYTGIEIDLETYELAKRMILPNTMLDALTK